MCVSNFICLLPLFGKLKVSSSSKFLSLFGKVFLFLNAFQACRWAGAQATASGDAQLWLRQPLQLVYDR